VSGLLEELALEREALLELEVRAAEAWSARRYDQCHALRAEAQAAREHIGKLEAEESEQASYVGLADEVNDGDTGPWDESYWDAQAVKEGKAYASRHGLPWPPGPGDFDRWYEAQGGRR